jgi:hypothetical protein
LARSPADHYAHSFGNRKSTSEIIGHEKLAVRDFRGRFRASLGAVASSHKSQGKPIPYDFIDIDSGTVEVLTLWKILDGPRYTSPNLDGFSGSGKNVFREDTPVRPG